MQPPHRNATCHLRIAPKFARIKFMARQSSIKKSTGWKLQNCWFSADFVEKTGKILNRHRERTVNLLQTYSWRLFIVSMRMADLGKITKFPYLEYFLSNSWNYMKFWSSPPLAYRKPTSRLLPTVVYHLTWYGGVRKNHKKFVSPIFPLQILKFSLFRRIFEKSQLFKI